MSKLTTLADAARLVSDGDHVALGGFACARNATAFTHELIRQNRRDLTISAAILGLEADLLVGAGCVARAIYGGGSIDRFGQLNRVNAGYEDGSLGVEYLSSLALSFRYLAGALGVPFMPIGSMLGSDVLRGLQRVAPDTVRESTDPFTGRPVVLLRALEPDFAVLHAQLADEDGNTRVLGPTWDGIESAKASRRVIVVAERIVSSDELRLRPELTSLPGLNVEAVVHVPFGAHPTSVYDAYDHDAEHLRMYAKRNASAEGFRGYLDEFVLGVTDHPAYLEKVGGASLRARLAAQPHRGY